MKRAFLLSLFTVAACGGDQVVKQDMSESTSTDMASMASGGGHGVDRQ
jgi:hypothetical protein